MIQARDDAAKQLVTAMCCMQYREEVMQPSMDPCAGTSPQKPAVRPGTEPAWMVHAETQTCSSSQAPLWADEHFAFLELSRPPNGHAGDEEQCMQPHAKQPSWSKVKVHFAAILVCSLVGQGPNYKSGLTEPSGISQMVSGAISTGLYTL